MLSKTQSSTMCKFKSNCATEGISLANKSSSWVQYYNTDACSAASLFSSTGTLNKNTDVSFGWVDWLKSNSKNKNIQLYLGLPASPGAANQGFYIDLQKTTALI